MSEREQETIAIIGTLDTKGAEILYVKRLLEGRGHRVLTIDTGVLGEPAFSAHITRQQVAAAAGSDVGKLAAAADRGAALAVMEAGAVAVVAELHARGRLHGVIGLGGGCGTAIATAAMRALPFGLPKVMVSTMAGGDVGRYVGTRDIAMLNSVTDIMGLNPILRRVLANGAGAIAGMVEMKRLQEEIAEASSHPTVALTTFGATTPAVVRCRSLLEEKGYETLLFHASGKGGRAMEELIDEGAVDAVLDLTTTELADELCGGTLTAGPDRLEAAARQGIPQVVLPGAMDMVNFVPPETVPARYAGRLFYRHNPGTLLMRTTTEENAILGRWVGEKLARSSGPATLVLPLRGFSEYDREGAVFYDREADRAFVEAAMTAVGNRVRVVTVDAHLNDPECADTAVELLMQAVARRRARRGS